MPTTPTPPFDTPMATVDEEMFHRDQASHSYLSFAFQDALAELAKVHGDKWVERFIAKRIRRGAEQKAGMEQHTNSILTGQAAEQSAQFHQKRHQDGSDALRGALAALRADPEPTPYLPEDGAI